jgi:3-isopropylmalate dehydrogenase
MSSARTIRVTVLGGDGIGPEVAAEGEKVLRAIAERFGHELHVTHAPVGGAAIDATGEPLPEETLTHCRASDAVLLGAVGGPKWDTVPAARRPESGLLALRKSLGLYANVRPVRATAATIDASPLKRSIIEGVDLVVVRELTGGIYFGDKVTETIGGVEQARDTCSYSVPEIERVTRVAATMARARTGRLTSVDKANVLETSRLWRRVVTRVMQDEFPDVRLDHLLVDACAMHLVTRPASFDVIVTENMFGDILTDEASVLAGSIGLLPSASLGDSAQSDDSRRFGLYEPIHGSAPDIAGRSCANPVGTILSVSMMLRHSLGLTHEASCLDEAVAAVLDAGQGTADVQSNHPCTTSQLGDAVAGHITAMQLL